MTRKIQKLCRKLQAAYQGCPINDADDEELEIIEEGIIGKKTPSGFEYNDKDYQIMLENLFNYSIRRLKELRKELRKESSQTKSKCRKA